MGNAETLAACFSKCIYAKAGFRPCGGRPLDRPPPVADDARGIGGSPRLRSFSMPTVSLIVPAYQAAEFLPAAAESVLRQEMSAWELILVDDGSQDATWEVIQRYMAADPRIRGLRKDNAGVASARNDGFVQTDPASRYLFFLDADDQLEPTALGRMSTYLDAHPEVGLLGCQFQEISADGRKLGTGKRSRWAPGGILPHELRDDEIETPFATFYSGTGQGPFAMYRRSVYEQTEGWEPILKYHEDTDMFCQMALLAKVHYLPDRLYLKRTHPAQSTQNGGHMLSHHTIFREKWDHRQGRNPQETALLQDARKYYCTVHVPCRDMKVGVKEVQVALRERDLGRLRWSVKLAVGGAGKLLAGRLRT